MSEKIIPLALSFNTNRYAGIDKVKPAVKNTIVIDANIFDYGDVFEKKKFETGKLYSLEASGKVKGLFEGAKNGDFVSLTKTFEGGLLEKIKNGATTMFARYSKNGELTDLVEMAGDKFIFMSHSGQVSEAVGHSAQAKLRNVIKGIKII